MHRLTPAERHQIDQWLGAIYAAAPDAARETLRESYDNIRALLHRDARSIPRDRKKQGEKLKKINAEKRKYTRYKFTDQNSKKYFVVIGEDVLLQGLGWKKSTLKTSFALHKNAIPYTGIKNFNYIISKMHCPATEDEMLESDVEFGCIVRMHNLLNA